MPGGDDTTPRVARVFDGTSEGEPCFSDREKISNPEERAAVLGYLLAATVLLAGRGMDIDRVEPSKGRVVPIHFRTDGSWVWMDAVPYYLETYGFAPDPDFLAHIRGRSYTFIQPSKEKIDSARKAWKAGTLRR